MGMVEKLIERAMHFKHLCRTRTAKEIAGEHTTTPPGNKRRRMSKKNLVLPPERLEGSPSDHCCVIVKKRTSCKYCYFLKMKHRESGADGDPPSIANVNRMCNKCGVHLCTMHFHPYHCENGHGGGVRVSRKM